MPGKPPMRRWVIDRYGRESLRIDEVPVPAPGPGEIRVKVAAVALNARDPMMIDDGMGLEDVIAQVHRLTHGRGVDHALDLVGDDNFARSIEAVAPGGRVSVIGLLGGTELRAATTPVLLKAPVIQGIVTGHRRALEDLVRASDRIGLKPVIDRRYAFTALPDAMDHLTHGAFGKVVVGFSITGD